MSNHPLNTTPVQPPSEDVIRRHTDHQPGAPKAERPAISGLGTKFFYERYGILENPFGVTPNPRYLYHSKTHGEARASLIIGIECGIGFQALIAPPGMGKTTILFNLLERFNKVARTAFLFQIHGGPRDFLRHLISELGCEAHDLDVVRMQDTINQLLIRERRAGRQTIIIIDEAQSLDTSVLETVRMLSNFETPTEKLLQIILAGQPQLAQRLANPELAQLHQRISILTTLIPFGLEDTRNYIDHRLEIAGYHGPPLFTPAALGLIWERSGGVPREINKLCFNALLLARAVEQKQVDSDILHEVVQDLDLDRIRFNTETPATSREVLQSGNGLRFKNGAADLPGQNSNETSQRAIPAADRAFTRPAAFENVESAQVATSRAKIVSTRDEEEVGENVVPHARAESDDVTLCDDDQPALGNNREADMTLADGRVAGLPGLEDEPSANSSDILPTPEASAAEPDLMTAARSEDQSCPASNLDSAPNFQTDLKSEQNSAFLAALAELRIVPVEGSAIDETAKPSRRASAGKVLVWLRQRWDAHKATIYLGISTEHNRWTRRRDWTGVLTAIVLALFLGWMMGRAGWQAVVSVATPSKETPVVQEPPSAPPSSAPKTSSRSARVRPEKKPVTPAEPNASKKPESDLAEGGLVVFEKGKVIFRMKPPSQSSNPETEPSTGTATESATANATGASPSAGPVPVSAETASTYLIQRVEPEYPQQAREQQIQGSVVLNATVGTDGAVRELKVVRGDPQLADAALNAVRRWRFKPYASNGQSVDFETRITVNFTLPEEVVRISPELKQN
jgi:general secretion pathway protein A